MKFIKKNKRDGVVSQLFLRTLHSEGLEVG